MLNFFHKSLLNFLISVQKCCELLYSFFRFFLSFFLLIMAHHAVHPQSSLLQGSHSWNDRILLRGLLISLSSHLPFFKEFPTHAGHLNTKTHFSSEIILGCPPMVLLKFFFIKNREPSNWGSIPPGTHLRTLPPPPPRPAEDWCLRISLRDFPRVVHVKTCGHG